MKNELKESILLSGIFILLFIVINILFSSILFIFNISISKFIAPISLLFCIIIIFSILLKRKMLCFKKIQNIIISIILPIFLIIIMIFLNGKVLDHSYDGNTYHKSTIGLLAEGWNPLYQTAEEFDNSQDTKIYIDGDGNSLWVNHYARASHIFQANIYSLTGNIESGKAINSLSIISLFLILFSYLSLKLNKVAFPFIFSLCAVTPSVIGAQFLTNYIDLLVYIYLLILLLSFFIIEFQKDKYELRIGLILFSLSLIMMINIKFTSFAYAGIFCLGYYIYYIVKLINKKISKKFFINFTITAAISVLIGVFVVGLAVYPKNFVTNGNAFYPLFGKEKVDIITANQPYYFENKSPIEKYVISMFSKASNISRDTKEEAEYKIPFTVDDTELLSIRTTDTRISGNGVLFGGIFILAMIVLIITSIKVFKKNKKVFILCTIPIAITIAMIFLLSESWWARYFPQTYLIILVDLIYLFILKSKFFKGILIGLAVLILMNNFITLYEAIKYSYDLNLNSNNQYRILKENVDKEKNKIIVSSPIFLGTLYNIKDKLKDYQLEIKDMSIEEVQDYNILMSGLVYWKWEANE